MEQSAKTKERFSETNESFTMLEAINEAKRCLHCKAPQCSKGCPISQDIPDWIHELSMGNLGNAMHIINGKSNLPCADAYALTSANARGIVYSEKRDALWL